MAALALMDLSAFSRNCRSSSSRLSSSEPCQAQTLGCYPLITDYFLLHKTIALINYLSILCMQSICICAYVHT